MAEPSQKKMTTDEFFAWQERQDRNYELVDGVPVVTVKAMTGASNQHDRITVNAISFLHQLLRGKPCRPQTSDTSIKTWRGTRRADVLVDCGKPDPRAMSAADPRVVIEVLSPSTMRYDRFQILAEYRRHPSIRVILLVDSEAPQVSVWRRTEETWSEAEVAGLDATIELPEIETSLPLAELYFDVPLEAAG